MDLVFYLKALTHNLSSANMPAIAKKSFSGVHSIRSIRKAGSRITFDLLLIVSCRGNYKYSTVTARIDMIRGSRRKDLESRCLTGLN